MSLQSFSNHPEHYPEGFAGIAFIGALLGKTVEQVWTAHHPRPAHLRAARAAVVGPRHARR